MSVSPYALANYKTELQAFNLDKSTVRPCGYCSPRHPAHSEASSIEVTASYDVSWQILLASSYNALSTVIYLADTAGMS
jgi:hypothetical protein